MGPQNLNPIDELQTLDQQVEQVTDLSGLKPIFFRLEEISKQYPNDFQVQLSVGDIKQHLVNRGTKLKQQPAAPPPLSTMPPSAPPLPPPLAAGPPPVPSMPAAPPPMPTATAPPPMPPPVASVA